MKSSGCDRKAEVACGSILDPLVGDTSKGKACELIDDSIFKTSEDKTAGLSFLCIVSIKYRQINSDKLVTYKVESW